MTDLFSDFENESGKYSGLVKLISARKKVEAILTRSIRSADASFSSTTLVNSPAHTSALQARYMHECHQSGVRPQRSVAKILAANSRELNLSACYLGPNGSIPLVRCLVAAPHLRVLLLDSCGLTDDSMLALAEFLSDSNELRTLDLSGNPNIGHVGGFALERMVAHSLSLCHVNTTGTSIRESTKRAIERICMRRMKSVSLTSDK